MASVALGLRAARLTSSSHSARCRLHPSRRRSLAVRGEVARRAGVAPQSVWASDRLPEEWGDLFIRASLDSVEFVMQLEVEFGVSIPDWSDLIFSRESVSVASLAADLCGAALGQGRPGERPRSCGEIATALWSRLRGRSPQ